MFNHVVISELAIQQWYNTIYDIGYVQTKCGTSS
jgi:hypothetical protein